MRNYVCVANYSRYNTVELVKVCLHLVLFNTVTINTIYVCNYIRTWYNACSAWFLVISLFLTQPTTLFVHIWD